MEEQLIDTTLNRETELLSERERLVRWCARLTGDAESAEDLTQETLLEAWKHMNDLRDPQRRTQWLFGIARNVYLRWARKRGRDAAHLATVYPDQEMQLEESIADDLDIEVELERKELIELLDRSLALLPPETRIALVKHYVEESPLGEIAAELGSNASAIAVRLQRGKLAMRRLLTRSQEDFTLLGQRNVGDQWEETRIWCPYCGQRRLLGIFRPDGSRLRFKCPSCNPDPEDFLSNSENPTLLIGVKGYKPALSRVEAYIRSFYVPGLKAGNAPCGRCGNVIPVMMRTPDPDDLYMQFLENDQRIIYAACSTRGSKSWSSLGGIVHATLEAYTFKRRYSRVHTIQKALIETHGRPARVTIIESLTENAHLDIVSDYETFEVLEIGGTAL